MKTATRISPLILIMLLAVGGLALTTGYLLLWQILLLTVPLIVTGFIWVHLGTSRVEILPIGLQERNQLGEELEVTALVNNKSILPKFMMKISQTASLPGYDLRLALNMAGKTSYLWRSSVNCSRRGRFTVSPISLEVSDPFGIFRRRRYIGQPQSVLVFPSVKELTLTSLLSHSQVSSSHSRWLLSRSSGDISRVREYADGDALNRIHWRSTAHTGQLMVKDFCEDRVRSVWILLDMSRSSAKNNRSGDAVEERITVTASLAKYYVEKGYPVGLLCEGDKSLVINSQSGETHYWYLMEALATIKAEGHKSLEDILTAECRRFKHGSLVFIVSSAPNHELLLRTQHLNIDGAQAAFVIPDGAPKGTQGYEDLCREFGSYDVPIYLAESSLDET